MSPKKVASIPIKATRIILYSSELAAFIGKNPHMYSSKIFNRLFQKYFPTKDVLAVPFQTDSQTIDLISEKTSNKNFRFQLDEIIKNNNSSFLVKSQKDSLVNQIIQSNNLSQEDQQLLVKIADSYTNKKFGEISEKTAIEVYEDRTGEEVVKKIDSRVKKILEYNGIELVVKSKIDAMKYDGTIVEVKNRIYKLFEEVREYEWLQVQVYMEVYNLERGQLVEYLRGTGEMRVTELQRDRKYWEEIVVKQLGNYFRTMINLVGDSVKRKKYLSLTETEQNEMIKKMIRKEEKTNQDLIK